MKLFFKILFFVLGSAIAAMSSPASAIAGEAAHLARDLGTTASQSAALVNVPGKDNQNEDVKPRSGINFVLYSNTFEVVDENTGILPVEDNINQIQTLATDKLVMQESGFIEIFANNDAQTPVYFDNMTVTHTPGRVLEVNTCYPYGMLIPELSAKAATKDEQNWYKFSSKELETALNLNVYDFGARVLPQDHPVWLTPDPLAEKYYSFSPYHFVGNNPIRFVDSNGMNYDEWEMDYSGRVKWIEESKEHTMYALNKNGVRTGQSITLKNRVVFDGLASTGAESEYNASFVKGNPSDLASVFLFGADNSNVEWRFSRYNEGNGDQYALGTAHKEKLSISTGQMGYDRASEIAFMHSHPGNYPTINDMYFSMGWREMTNDELGFYNRPKGSPYLYGDSDAWKVYYESNKHPGNRNSYVYFPSSKDVYHVRGYYHPAHIKNITNHNYNPQKLFWGTLNGR